MTKKECMIGEDSAETGTCNFGRKPPGFMGIESELLCVNGESGALSSAEPVLHEVPFKSHVHPEFHQSMVEVKTSPYLELKDHRMELNEICCELNRVAIRHGNRLVGMGTHPFSDWSDQQIQVGTRYKRLVENNPNMKLGPIASMHVHISCENWKEALKVHNIIREFLPMFMALSTNSPFFASRRTGSKSMRYQILRSWNYALTDVPPVFQSPCAYHSHMLYLKSYRMIGGIKDFWAPVRIRPDLGTVEMRIMDMPSGIEDVIALAALFQSLYFFIRESDIEPDIQESTCFNHVAYDLKQAADHGLAGELSMPQCLESEPQGVRIAPTRAVIRRMVDLVRPYAEEMGVANELKGILNIIDGGTGADIQVRICERTRSVQSVVMQAIELAKSFGCREERKVVWLRDFHGGESQIEKQYSGCAYV